MENYSRQPKEGNYVVYAWRSSNKYREALRKKREDIVKDKVANIFQRNPNGENIYKEQIVNNLRLIAKAERDKELALIRRLLKTNAKIPTKEIEYVRFLNDILIGKEKNEELIERLRAWFTKASQKKANMNNSTPTIINFITSYFITEFSKKINDHFRTTLSGNITRQQVEDMANDTIDLLFSNQGFLAHFDSKDNPEVGNSKMYQDLIDLYNDKNNPQFRNEINLVFKRYKDNLYRMVTQGVASQKIKIPKTKKGLKKPGTSSYLKATLKADNSDPIKGFINEVVDAARVALKTGGSFAAAGISNMYTIDYMVELDTNSIINSVTNDNGDLEDFGAVVDRLEEIIKAQGELIDEHIIIMGNAKLHSIFNQKGNKYEGKGNQSIDVLTKMYMEQGKSMDWVNDLLHIIYNTMEGAILYKNKQILGEITQTLFTVAANFFFDDWILIGKTYNNISAIHLFSLHQGMNIPLSYVLYGMADALEKSLLDAERYMKVSINAGKILYNSPTEYPLYGKKDWDTVIANAWATQALEAQISTTFSSRFLSNIKKITSDYIT